ncbi:MAG: phasin family protein [Gammaproteobacteria bacterium]|nr:phasin family protein [Gammaproteobacteria bacterium]
MSKNRKSDQDAEHQLADKIKESARQIWLAGLGAYTKAEEDAGKLFERLVREGEELEGRTRNVVERQIKVVEDRVEEVKEKATGTWDKLESLFDQRVSNALQRLGIPTKCELQALQDRIDALEAQLARQNPAADAAAPAKPRKR